MDYSNHIREGSILNTPPVFAVYVCLLTLQWLKKSGGIASIEKINNEKAGLLYKEIDDNPLFTTNVAKEDRSKMNVCFVMKNKDLELEFLSFTKQHGIVGIKGHRTAGGFRASLYNALPVSSVGYLIELMKDFALRFN
jgi:phosphoserine aminotransferase